MKRMLCFLLALVFAAALISCGERVDVFDPSSNTAETSKATVHTLETPLPSANPNESTPTDGEPISTVIPTLNSSDLTPDSSSIHSFASFSPEEAAEIFGEEKIYRFSEEYEFFEGYWCNEHTVTLLKRDRKTDVVTPVCIDSACTHNKKSGCPFADIEHFYPFGNDLYFSTLKTEYVDDVRKDTYSVFRYDLQDGKLLTIYQGNENSQFPMYVLSYPFPVYNRVTTDAEFNKIVVWYKITPSGDSKELYRISISLHSYGDIWKDRYAVVFNAVSPTTTPKLYDTVTGEIINLNCSGMMFSCLPMIADRYLLFFSNIEGVTMNCLYNLETKKTVILSPKPKYQTANKSCIVWAEDDRIIHVFNLKTWKEDTYELPEGIKAIQFSVVDGKILIGDRPLRVNGKRINAFDLQVDLLSGRVRYRTEKIEVYSPDMPPYIVLEKEEVS